MRHEYDSNETRPEKLPRVVAQSVVIGAFATLVFLVGVGVVTVLRMVF